MTSPGFFRVSIVTQEVNGRFRPRALEAEQGDSCLYHTLREQVKGHFSALTGQTAERLLKVLVEQ